MEINFSILISALSGYEMKVYRNAEPDLTYQEVRFLYDSEIDFKKNILYLGKASMLANKSLNIRDIGLILIKDVEFNPAVLQADIALFSCETNMLKLFDHVLTIFNSKRKLVDSSASLLNSLIKGKGLNYIVQVGSEILGNPVILIDASSKLLASSANTNIDDSFWNDLATLGYGNDNNLVSYVHDGSANQVHQNPLPVLIDPGIPNHLKRIVGKIQVKEKTVGYIGVLEHNQKLKEEDINIAGLLCDVVASEMQKSKLYDNLTGVRHEFLLIDLLDGKIRNSTLVRERANAIFQTSTKNLFVMVINPPENIVNTRTLGYLRWAFEGLLPSCKSVYYNDNLVLIINSTSINQWLDFKRKLINILERNNLTAGLSLMFHDMMDIKKHFLQAESASRIGKRLNKYDILQEYEDLYIYDLLSNLKEDTNASDFCHPVIGKIKDYDKSNGTDYYNTLYEYLVCGGNISLLAKKLFHHRNTIVHRISKIQDITGIDLNDGNNRFKLLLSYRIMELPV